MGLSIAYRMYTPAAVTASSQAAGYPAVAVMTPGVLRGWQSTAGGTQWIQLDLGTSMVIDTVAVQASNFLNATGNSARVLADNNVTPITDRGPLGMGQDENGRYKGSLSLSSGFVVARYVRIALNGFGATRPYSIGSVFVFGASLRPAADPVYGGSRITQIDPQGRNDLPNGIVESYVAGPSSSEIELAFRATAAQDVELIKRTARAEPSWLDLGTPERGRQWPVRTHEPQVSRSIDGYNREAVMLKLREIV